MSRIGSRAQWRIVLGAVAVLGIGLASSASADTILFNPDGTGPAGAFTVGSFNWTAGTAVAEGAIPLSVGTTFTVLYETTLAGLNDPNGSPVGVPNLNVPGGIQITEIATLKEVVTSLTTAANGNVTAQFALTPGGVGTVSIYEGTYQPPNFVTGTGFTTGTPIYQATVTQDLSGFTDKTPTEGTTGLNHFTSGNYGGVSTHIGDGNVNITMATNPGGANPLFFVTQPILSSLFSAGTHTPFDQQAPATTFWNGFAPNPGSVNGSPLAGPDFLFQVSAATQSFTVPEPTSIIPALTAATGIPMFLCLWRRRSKKAVS